MDEGEGVGGGAASSGDGGRQVEVAAQHLVEAASSRNNIGGAWGSARAWGSVLDG